MDTDDSSGPVSGGANGPHVVETRQLWWQVHNKMQNPDYSNMQLLVKMEDWLEDLMFNRSQKFMTKAAYEKMINQVHLDAEGTVVEPFVALSDAKVREERQRLWYETMEDQLEEECLIK